MATLTTLHNKAVDDFLNAYSTLLSAIWQQFWCVLVDNISTSIIGLFRCLCSRVVMATEDNLFAHSNWHSSMKSSARHLMSPVSSFNSQDHWHCPLLYQGCWGWPLVHWDRWHFPLLYQGCWGWPLVHWDHWHFPLLYQGCWGWPSVHWDRWQFPLLYQGYWG